MELKNFSFRKSVNHPIIEIDYSGEIFDLHNAAEFIKIEYSIERKEVVLIWNYYYWEKSIIQIQLVCEGVDFFKVFPRDADMPCEEDDCIEEIVHGEKLTLKFIGGMQIIIGGHKVSFIKK